MGQVFTKNGKHCLDAEHDNSICPGFVRRLRTFARFSVRPLLMGYLWALGQAERADQVHEDNLKPSFLEVEET